MKNLIKAKSVQPLFYILPDDFDSLMVKTKKYVKCNVYSLILQPNYLEDDIFTQYLAAKT